MNSPCCICLDFCIGSEICVTTCGHVFHSKCIFRWIDSSEACPECRRNLTKNSVIKLHCNTNNLDSKKGGAIFSKLSLAKAKIKDIQELLAKKEAELQEIHEKYLWTEIELTSTTGDLRSRILETYNLIHEKDSLVRHLCWFKQLAYKILGTTMPEGVKRGTSLSDNTSEVPFDFGTDNEDLQIIRNRR